jgi:hypothetical protein
MRRRSYRHQQSRALANDRPPTRSEHARCASARLHRTRRMMNPRRPAPRQETKEASVERTLARSASGGARAGHRTHASPTKVGRGMCVCASSALAVRRRVASCLCSCRQGVPDDARPALRLLSQRVGVFMITILLPNMMKAAALPNVTAGNISRGSLGQRTRPMCAVPRCLTPTHGANHVEVPSRPPDGC